jgi:putative Mg2+ transporter-C (MgtC) family protein
MPITIEWPEVALRLALTVVAGTLIGLNRSEHGHSAGLRTTLLACLAASVSMIQVNLLLSIGGKSPGSFAVLDLMRLPLGILSGMGFIGAGAIVCYGSLVRGLTTAPGMEAVGLSALVNGFQAQTAEIRQPDSALGFRVDRRAELPSAPLPPKPHERIR